MAESDGCRVLVADCHIAAPITTLRQAQDGGRVAIPNDREAFPLNRAHRWAPVTLMEKGWGGPSTCLSIAGRVASGPVAHEALGPFLCEAASLGDGTSSAGRAGGVRLLRASRSNRDFVARRREGQGWHLEATPRWLG